MAPRPQPAYSLDAVASDREVIAGRYEVVAELARGGMGVVYRVLDRSTHSECALKRILTTNHIPREVAVRFFEQEYRVLASLDHPRIIRVYAYGLDEQGPFYTMELLPGSDFAQSIVPWREACLYLRDLATSLSLLHARKLLHRDLNPRNVKRTEDGHCKLLDFGALTTFGYSQSVVGIPPAIPPEALQGGMLDPRADLYSLGAFAYYVLTGHHAYPASVIDELREVWAFAPPPPSAYVGEIPRELDTLVLSLLSKNPLARPNSAADLIAQLNSIAQLPVEDERERGRLALSYLHTPGFVGRERELELLEGAVRSLITGRGAALRIQAVAGSGRTRLLEELGIRAQLAGASVLRVDASSHPHQHGTSQALAARLVEALPELARERSHRHGLQISSLAPQARAREVSLGPAQPDVPVDMVSALDAWMVEISHERPLVVAVDNVELADDASLALLLALSRRTADHPVLLIVSERTGHSSSALGLVALRTHCQLLSLSGLSLRETLSLARSIFGEAPNIERFGEWLYDSSSGSPLYFIEVSRQLAARSVIRYENGMWVLPASRPNVRLPDALEGALSVRLASLSQAARALSECLSLQRDPPTLELCRLLVESELDAEALLDELTLRDVLSHDSDGYRFSSSALRESLLTGMQPYDREYNHRRLGEAFLRLAQPNEHARKIEAGFHLIRGGEETRGADCIAQVMGDTVAVRKLLLNLYRAGVPAEAALKVYKRERRTLYERVPLLAVLAQASQYEDYGWEEKYGDEALDALEQLSGMRLARRLRRFCGRYLALVTALLFAFTRFYLVPKRERGYSFRDLLIQLFTGVSTLTGLSAMKLDGDRAERIAGILEPFSVLNERLTPRGVYQFCIGMQEIARERQAAAFETFQAIEKRFADPRYYPALPSDARVTYRAACHFALGAFAIFRNDSSSALESAKVLDGSGYKLHAMIASQLRFLYHANRGELAEASKHRERVEIHAAQVGSAFQVELWEGAALLPLYLMLGDTVAVVRIEHRMNELAAHVPSLELYRRFAHALAGHLRNEPAARAIAIAEREVRPRAPRSFIGWSPVMGFLAMAYSRLDDPERAEACCERALLHTNVEDLEYVNLFLLVELQMAYAQAKLGKVELALARLDGLIARFAPAQHPLALGSLHEARALIALSAGRRALYEESLREVERWFRATATPLLVAKCERLVALGRGDVDARARPSLANLLLTASATVVNDV